MIRRVSRSCTPRLIAAAAAQRTAGARQYFYKGAGEEGISKATLYFTNNMFCLLSGIAIVYIYVGVYSRHGTHQLYPQSTTDLWEDDGTIMDGEEAVANLRIQRERLMPFMDQIQERIDALSGDGASAVAHDHAHHH